MSDIKISALPSAGSLTGAEAVPIVQGGVTKQVTLSAIAALTDLSNVVKKDGSSGDFTLANHSISGINTLISNGVSSGQLLDHNSRTKVDWENGVLYNYQSLSVKPKLDWTLSDGITVYNNSGHKGNFDLSALTVDRTIAFQNKTYIGVADLADITAAAVSPLTTKGDIWVRNGSVDTRLPVGTDGYVLTADSAQSSGVKWAAVSAGSSTLATLTDVNLTTPANGDLLKYDSGTSKWINFSPSYLTANQTITLSGDVTGSGTTAITITVSGSIVKNVVLNTPNVIFSTPVTFTTSGNTATGSLTLNTQTANTVLAGPTSGAASTPTFRALVASDIPSLNYQSPLTGSGIVKSTSGAISYVTGTSSQFVKADGSLDSNTYLTSVTTDATPTNGSANPVQSGGVYTALQTKLSDNRINNMVYDSLFQSSIDQNGNTIQGSKFFWWDETIVGLGTVKRQIANTLSQGTKSGVIKIDTSTTGATTQIAQTLWYHDYPELDFFADKLSFSVWVKQTVASSGKLIVQFLDRNLSVGVNLSSGVSQFSVTANTTTGAWQQLKIENITMPYKTALGENTGNLSNTPFEGSIAVRIVLQTLTNNSTVEFSEPMVNIGSTALPFQPRAMDWSVYGGMEDFAYKLWRKQNISMDNYGDSISVGPITSLSDQTSQPNFFGLFAQFLASKFGVTVTTRNCSANGQAPPNAFLNFYRNTILNNSDLVIFSHGRNITNTSYSGTVADNLPLLEGMIRKYKNAVPKGNYVMTLPFYKRLDSGGLTEANYSQYNADRQLLAAFKGFNSMYGGANVYSQEKIRILGEKGLWWPVFAITSSSGETTHPYTVGHNYYYNELKHILYGSYLNSSKPRVYVTPSVTQETIAPNTEKATILFPSQFTVPGSYQDGSSSLSVTVNAVVGTWTDDTNIDSTQLSTNKKFIGAGALANLYGFGQYELPKVSGVQNDYVDISWAGKYFMIWFNHCNNRGNALITINGTAYTFSTNDPFAEVAKHLYPTFTNCITGANPSSLSALPSGTNTIRIQQKDTGTNTQIAIVAIALF